ncbi:Flagellar motor switch protein FliN [Poriferisphaera corsica]|uniref:Flagellar motor switch protein FliN n=1 Tax=Poriferisphaera corsica TaxID=2528020 RepID=A0A517YSH4_9BACT|nr:flagellar motor switch protein FliN [Poriferisphaera corsica]QDU33180.1 Flagellar motor switch protein FliN [Poriferisphaera corsica]
MAEDTQQSTNDMTQDTSVQDALDQAQASVNEIKDQVDQVNADFNLPDFTSIPEAEGIEMLSDVDLGVTIELGRTEMLVEDVLRLAKGSVVELDKLAGDPVDVRVNGRLVARGEVLVLNDNFCIRISEIVANLDEPVESLIPGLEAPRTQPENQPTS